MTNYCKHDIYKNIFNKLYSKFIIESEKVSEKLREGLEIVDQNLNYMLNSLYPGQAEKIPFPSQIYYNKEIKGRESIVESPKYDWTEHLEKLNKIQTELKKIMKENFKVKEGDECELSRNHSEAVLIDREELTDCNKTSPVVNLRLGKDANNAENLSLEANDNLNLILNLIKKLNEISKAPDHSSKI
jgi:hypothetical protein